MNTNQVSKVFRNLTMKMCHVSFEMIIINKHIHKLLASRYENLFGMKIFTRINNLKFLKNGTKRQIVMRSWKREREKYNWSIHKMRSKKHKWHNNNQKECLIFKIGYSHTNEILWLFSWPCYSSRVVYRNVCIIFLKFRSPIFFSCVLLFGR